MTTNATRRVRTEAIVPDAIIADGKSYARRAAGTDRSARRLRFVDRVLVVMVGIAVIALASVVAVGVAVTLAVMLVVGAVIAAGRTVAAKVRH